MENLFDFAKFAIPLTVSVLSFVWWLSKKFETQTSSYTVLGQKLDLSQKSTEQLIQSTKDNLTIQLAALAEKQIDISKHNDRRLDEVAHRLDVMESKYNEFEREGSAVIKSAQSAVMAADKARRKAESNRVKAGKVKAA